VVYLFDDLHLKFGDMAQVRQAADRQISTLQPGDEAAILSTSGLVQLAFTADKAKLHEALLKVRASPLGDRAEHGCPEVSFYQADQILNVYPLDPAVSPPLQVAVADAIACLHSGDTRDSLQGATKFALTAAIDAARRTEDEGKRNTRGALLAIRDVLRWLSPKPGNKILVLVSSGFILTTDQLEVEGGVIEQAIGSHVSISTLDARGLFTAFPTAEFAGRPTDSTAFRMKLDLMRQEAVASDVVLKDLADGTGGGFVGNTNDLDGGLQRLAAPPAYTYVLGFRPEHMKSDGRFHALTVKLKKGSKLTAQARRGYFAPKQ
jgi:VWFA-related protein